MTTVFSCEEVTQPEFRIHYAEACMLANSADQGDVLAIIWRLTEQRGASGNGETVGYFAASHPDPEAVALLVMANNNCSWARYATPVGASA